ncbi:MAG: GIY-YIG nuclease family protein [Symbiopectobacterium sp.]
MSIFYILTNKPNGTLYIGITGNLIRRIWQHNNLKIRGFTHRYNVNQLGLLRTYLKDVPSVILGES